MPVSIRVFYTTLSNYNDSFYHTLSAPEKRRADSYRQERKKLYILGRTLLRKSLFYLTGDADYRISYQENGKPILIYPQEWNFNITHSGEHLLLALRKNNPIGIDSEIMRTRSHYTKIAKRLFSEDAYQHIISSEDSSQAFYYHWTRYEAIIKYYGLAIFKEIPDTAKQLSMKSYIYNDVVFSLSSSGVTSHYTFYQQQHCRDEFIQFNPNIITFT